MPKQSDGDESRNGEVADSHVNSGMAGTATTSHRAYLHVLGTFCSWPKYIIRKTHMTHMTYMMCNVMKYLYIMYNTNIL